MIIKITNLPIGVHAFKFENSVKELQIGEPFIGNLILDCKIDKSQHQIVANCNLTISEELICDRCLEKYETQLEKEFSLIFLYNKNDVDNSDANVKYLSPTAETLNLTDDVIDYAFLTIPMKHLCSEDCLGLCPRCGNNLNHDKCSCKDDEIDPKWESLLKLKDKLK